ncbi:hypothetical protein C1S79_01315 [Mycolicibacterium phocaicum]|uniref:Uncharacterized protein n=1 Tax=Mycolicibacterium phocaicum TaxID=319706 RepID=A0AA94RIG7_9MYCO|nr:hypothetical protein C1S79_01315 [Mycolicibacterium phocaicum]
MAVEIEEFIDFGNGPNASEVAASDDDGLKRMSAKRRRLDRIIQQRRRFDECDPRFVESFPIDIHQLDHPDRDLPGAGSLGKLVDEFVAPVRRRS